MHFGGSLWQDIETQCPGSGVGDGAKLLHRVLGRYEHHHHTVEFVPGTRLARLFPGVPRITTNSIHHQGIKDLAPDFVAEARAVRG